MAATGRFHGEVRRRLDVDQSECGRSESKAGRGHRLDTPPKVRAQQSVLRPYDVSYGVDSPVRGSRLLRAVDVGVLLHVHKQVECGPRSTCRRHDRQRPRCAQHRRRRRFRATHRSGPAQAATWVTPPRLSRAGRADTPTSPSAAASQTFAARATKGLPTTEQAGGNSMVNEVTQAVARHPSWTRPGHIPSARIVATSVRRVAQSELRVQAGQAGFLDAADHRRSVVSPLPRQIRGTRLGWRVGS